MKLKNDFFIPKEVQKAELNIKQNILNYIQDNNLTPCRSDHDKNSIVLNPQGSNMTYYKPITDFYSFFKSNYKVVDIQNKTGVSHNIHIAGTTNFQKDNADFYFFLQNNAQNDLEKIILVKTIFSNLINRYSFLDEFLKKIPTDDYWFHLRHIIPFGKSSKSVHDIRSILTSLDNKSIDTDEKSLALLYTLQHYKQICKRSDIQAGLSRTLRTKLDSESLKPFEDLLKINLTEDGPAKNIFKENKETVCLILDKEQLFEQLLFNKVPQAKVDNHNRYLLTLNSFLTNDKIKSQLNIDYIDFVELSSQKHPARVYIVANENGFKEDIKEIYSHLLTSCTHHLDDGYKQNTLPDSFNKSLSFFMLDKTMNNNKEDKSQVKKLNKI